MNVTQFASSIKTKFPQYAGIGDEELSSLIVAKYPQYASQVDLSVAGVARARLANQGLTPEAVKATGAPRYESPSMMDEFASGGTAEKPGLLDYLASAGGALAKMVPTENPANPIAMANTAVTMGANMGRDFTQADSDFANDPARRRIQKVAAAIPLVGDVAHDLLQPSFVATNREPTAAERMDAMGAAVQAGALAAPAAIKGSASAGPRVVSAAERSYAGIIEPPLTESLARQMMDRGIVVRDPKTMATNAAAAEQAALAERQAIIDRNPMPERWRSTPARREAAQQVRSAEAEAKFQSDLQTVAETIKAPARSGNILTGTTGKVLAMIPGVDTVARIVGTVRDLYEFPKSPAFKTATALAKREFGKAMNAADHALAADIGAAIATGALADDEFGHRAAVRSLLAETEALPSPELRRQAVASKKLSYVDPTGRETPIPHNVMMGFVGASRLNESESPLSAWLTSMGKQGLIKPGGTIAINGTPSRKQSNPG